MNGTAFTVVFRRTWGKIARRPRLLLLSLVQPLLWMSFFGFLFQRVAAGELPGELSYVEFLLPGLCAMTVLVGASQSGIGIIRDMQTGLWERMLDAPASRGALLGGKIAADATRLLGHALVVAALGVALGVRFDLDVTLLPALGALLLFAIAYCALSCAIALRTRNQESLSAFVHLANMPIFFTSTALVPLKKMPPWLETVADHNPLTGVVEALRSAMFGLAFEASGALWIMLASAAVSPALVALSLRGPVRR